MAEGLGRERWAHTSIICTLIANAHRDPKKHRPFTPDDFNPYAEPGSRKKRSHRGTGGTGGAGGDVIEINNETIGLMRSAFTGSPSTRLLASNVERIHS